MKRIISIAFFTLIALYALFQGRFLILGPRIILNTPIEESMVDAGAIVASGVVKNVSSLTLNDRLIYTDTEGRFEEKLVVSRGINIIKLVGKDRFGRETEKLVRVVAN